MIGNAEEALFIHDWWHSGASPSYSQPPEGWTYVGGGCYRSAYLSPSGIVYKVQRDLSEGLWQTNYGEWQTWKRLYLSCKMPKRSRLPRLSYYPVPGLAGVGVIAIEKLSAGYYSYDTFTDENGKTRTWGEVCDAIGEATGVSDLYGDNLMIDTENNLLVPTDLGADTEYEY